MSKKNKPEEIPLDSQGRPLLLGPFYSNSPEYQNILEQNKKGDLIITAMNRVGCWQWTIEVRYPQVELL